MKLSLITQYFKYDTLSSVSIYSTRRANQSATWLSTPLHKYSFRWCHNKNSIGTLYCTSSAVTLSGRVSWFVRNQLNGIVRKNTRRNIMRQKQGWKAIVLTASFPIEVLQNLCSVSSFKFVLPSAHWQKIILGSKALQNNKLFAVERSKISSFSYGGFRILVPLRSVLWVKYNRAP